LRLLSEAESLLLTIKHYDNVMMKKTLIIKAESGDMVSLGSEGFVTSDNKQENFSETSLEEKLTSAGNSSNTQQGQRGTLDMGDFLSRPIRIYENTLALSTNIDLALQVWDLYSLVPSVRAKLKNFSYLRGNFHVRIVVSGTPFHYGRLLLSYQPFAVYNRTITQLVSGSATYSTIRPLKVCYLSQAPGSMTLDVKDNVPIEMVCPFISTKPMHRLFGVASTVISDSTSFPDFETAGTLYIMSINQIKAVTASPSTTYIQIYAWMEDVELGVGTATHLAITSESGKFDERKIGPVERISSSLYKVSSTLSSLPVIAPFAKASAMIFGALSGVSAIFGWSKPILNTHTVVMKNEPYQNGAYTIGTDTAKRVVLDPMQELTVDPRICGSTDDEMTISHIANRRSYMDTFTWGTGGALGTPIAVYGVTPCQVVDGVVLSTIGYDAPTSTSFAAAPFNYWRGDLIFRFEIVCSSFHRGKIAVFYEPNVSQSSLIMSSIDLNKQFIQVVDIQDTQVFDVRINWASYRAWLKTTTAVSSYTNNRANFLPRVGEQNGFIYLVPFTALQSPDNSAISINTYIMSDNLQVNGLTDNNLPQHRRVIVAESGKLNCETLSLSANVHEDVTCLELNDSTASTDKICDEHFGEQPVSFRSLLKRFVSLTYGIVAPSGYYAGNIINPILPVSNSPYGTVDINYQELFSYLRYAYLGIRGSIRYRFNSQLPVASPTTNMRAILMAPDTTETPSITYESTPCRIRLNGGVTFVPTTMGAIEAEFPFYSNNLFAISFKDNYYVNDRDIMEPAWYKLFSISFDVLTDVTVFYGLDIASGEDFNLMRYCGAPFYSRN